MPYTSPQALLMDTLESKPHKNNNFNKRKTWVENSRRKKKNSQKIKPPHLLYGVCKRICMEIKLLLLFSLKFHLKTKCFFLHTHTYTLSYAPTHKHTHTLSYKTIFQISFCFVLLEIQQNNNNKMLLFWTGPGFFSYPNIFLIFVFYSVLQKSSSFNLI